MICSEKCWTPVRCPDHGDLMGPFGRSVGMDAWECCENRRSRGLNPRHLWDEHDSTRWYTDPDGWDEHEKNCEQCRGDKDD